MAEYENPAMNEMHKDSGTAMEDTPHGEVEKHDPPKEKRPKTWEERYREGKKRNKDLLDSL